MWISLFTSFRNTLFAPCQKECVIPAKRESHLCSWLLTLPALISGQVMDPSAAVLREISEKYPPNLTLLFVALRKSLLGVWQIKGQILKSNVI